MTTENSHKHMAAAALETRISRADDLAGERIYRRPDVEKLVGLSRSTIYAMIAQGTFPKPVKLSTRAVGWRARDLQAWLEARSTDAS